MTSVRTATMAICFAGMMLATVTPLPAQEPDVAALTRQLRDGDRDQRREAARQLAELGPKAKPALTELIRGIQDRDPQIWEFSILAIDRLGPDAAAAVPVLIRQLSGARHQRYRTSVALGHIGKAALPELIRALDGSPAARRGAADALAVMGKPAAVAVDKLASLLADRDEEVREAAAKALASIGPAASAALKRTLDHDDPLARAAALSALEQLKETARPLQSRIEAACRDDDSMVRTAALRALARVSGVTRENARVFTRALQDENGAVQKAALDAIAAAPQTPLVLAQLLTLATEQGGTTQRYAVYLLGKHGAGRPEVVAVLAKLAAHPDEALREEVARSLVRMGRPAVAEILRQLGDSPEAAPVLASALARIGGPARHALLTALASNDPNARASAARALAQLPFSRESREALVRALSDSEPQVRVAAIQALLAHADELTDDDTAAIMARVEDRDAGVRAAAVGVYGLADRITDETLGAIRKRLEDRSTEVRAATLALLRTWDAVPETLVPVLVAQFESNDDVTLAALLELAAKSDQLRSAARRELSAALTKAARSPHPVLRRAAAVLAASRAREDKESRRVLAELIRDKDESVSLAALTALQNVEQPVTELWEPIRAAAQSGPEGVRIAAMRTFPHVAPNPEARKEVLLQLLTADSWTIRAEACRGLGSLGEEAKDAVPALLELLDRRDDEEAARSALQRIGTAGPEAVPSLRQMLRSRSPRRRTYAVYLLGRVEPAPVEALDDLRKLRSEGDERFQRLLRSTIQRIEQAAK